MFDACSATSEADLPLPIVREFDEFTRLKLEKDMVGIYLSGHPLGTYAELFEQFNFDTRQIARKTEEGEEIEASGDLDGKPITMGAIIVDVKRLKTKSTGKDMAVLSIEDLYGGCEIMLFPAVYDRVRNNIDKDMVIKITGKISARDGEDSIILADNIEQLSGGTQAVNINADAGAAVTQKTLYLRYNMSDATLHGEIMGICEAYRGELPVVIRNTATGRAVSPPNVGVRECKSVVSEVNAIIGDENVVLK